MSAGIVSTLSLTRGIQATPWTLRHGLSKQMQAVWRRLQDTQTDHITVVFDVEAWSHRSSQTRVTSIVVRPRAGANAAHSGGAALGGDDDGHTREPLLTARSPFQE